MSKVKPFILDGAEPDRYGLFAKLREMWVEAAATIDLDGKTVNRSFAALADHLDVPKQNVTQWATGSGGKAPAPWNYIMRLCDELGLGVNLTASKCELYKLPEE